MRWHSGTLYGAMCVVVTATVAFTCMSYVDQFTRYRYLRRIMTELLPLVRDEAWEKFKTVRHVQVFVVSGADNTVYVDSARGVYGKSATPLSNDASEILHAGIKPGKPVTVALPDLEDNADSLYVLRHDANGYVVVIYASIES